jgi:hypothetical protein
MTLRRWGALMLLVTAYSAIALAFLLGGLAIATVLTARGYGVIADVLVLNYLLLSLPLGLRRIRPCQARSLAHRGYRGFEAQDGSRVRSGYAP